MNYRHPGQSPQATVATWKTASLVMACLLALLWPPAPVEAAPAPAEAERLVKDTVERMVAAMSKDRSIIEKDPAHARSLVEQIAFPHVDFDLILRWVLGKHWRTASVEERTRFREEFQTSVLRTWATAVAEFSNNAKIDFLAQRTGDDGRKTIVPTKVHKPGALPLSVDYRLHNGRGEWKVYDVVVDGVSVVGTFREGYKPILKEKGVAGLVRDLEKKNREGTRSR